MVAQPPGYNITCDPGDLYNRKCYTNVYSTPGCDPATDPTCTISQQEIIGYTNDGQPISKAPSSASWLAWVPTLTTLDMSGMAIQPYGEAGLPYVSPSGQTNPTGEPDDILRGEVRRVLNPPQPWFRHWVSLLLSQV